MSGRLFFNESEKNCLMELIIKYKLNTVATTKWSVAVKKSAWVHLTEEYNSIESNSKRTEAQLRKCWDNLKSRRKNTLAHEKRERMRTGGGPMSLPSTSQDSYEAALTEQTDVELMEAIDSDYVPLNITDSQTDLQLETITLEVPHAASEHSTQINEPVIATDNTPQQPLVSEGPETLIESAIGRDHSTPLRFSESRLTDYGAAPSQGIRNVKTQVIQEEFNIRMKSYEKSQQRDEQLHKLKLLENEWMVKATQERYLQAKAERQSAEELLRCNTAKREEAELRLEILRKNNKT